ncbi:hypothetical protein Vadar_023135 [Vaccinium darrowii]|uniref:Uncharacterized protein n=1 Tax=Vaccinium darrowii TaxID=229202 RepID=A0ACB7ZDR5_9ERIC|nr:hypothetical protein Vadar_023135 [Vaccinium darrowii]
MVKAMQNVLKNNSVMGNKPNPTSKSRCICAPTTHVGSFRCHLHRTSTAKKSSQKLLEHEGNTQSIISMTTDMQQLSHQLSRFGRAALNKEEHENLVLNSCQVTAADGFS